MASSSGLTIYWNSKLALFFEKGNDRLAYIQLGQGFASRGSWRRPMCSVTSTLSHICALRACRDGRLYSMPLWGPLCLMLMSQIRTNLQSSYPISYYRWLIDEPGFMAGWTIRMWHLSETSGPCNCDFSRGQDSLFLVVTIVLVQARINTCRLPLSCLRIYQPTGKVLDLSCWHPLQVWSYVVD